MNLICFPNVIQLWSLRVINVFLPFMASICSQYKVDHKYWLWNLDAWQQLIYKVSSTGLESLNGSHASISHLTAVQTRLTICLRDEESKALWDDGLPEGPLLPTAEMGSQQSGLSPEPVVSASAQTERSGTQRKKTKVWQAGAFPFCVMLWGKGEGYMWVWICKGCTQRPENIRCPALSLSASLPWDHISHYIWHVAPQLFLCWWLTSPSHPPISASQCHSCGHAGGCAWCSQVGAWSPFLMLRQQLSFLLDHLFNP